MADKHLTLLLTKDKKFYNFYLMYGREILLLCSKSCELIVINKLLGITVNSEELHPDVYPRYLNFQVIG